MSGNAAAKTLMEIELAKLEREGRKPTEEDLLELYEHIKARYEETLDPRYAAARLWVDEVIFPHETRRRLVRSLGSAPSTRGGRRCRSGCFRFSGLAAIGRRFSRKS